MNLDLIQKHLGRIPNDTEQLFFKKFWDSFLTQSFFESEASQAEIQSDKGPKLTLVAQGKSDPRKLVAENIIQAQNGQKFAVIPMGNGSFILGHSSKELLQVSGKAKNLYLLRGSNIKKTIQELYQQDWFQGAVPVHKGGFGFSIYQLLKNRNCGIEMSLKHSDDLNILSKTGTHGLLILISHRGIDTLQTMLKKTKAGFTEVGCLTRDLKLELFIQQKSAAHIPVSILDLLVHQGKDFDEIKMQTMVPEFPPPKLKEKMIYNNELVKLVEDFNSHKGLIPSSKKLDAHNGIFTLIKNKVRFGVVVNDNDYINYNDYRMKAISAIANSARQLVCAGILPEVCSGFVTIPASNQSEKGSFLKGIKDAGQILNLSVAHLSFEIGEGMPHGEFCMAGTCIRHEIFPNTFRESDLFISILGSHRGELGGSRYLTLLNQDKQGSRPVVDLMMESRLQETVLTGIQSGLIQSARAVGRGGVAVTIAKSFENNTQFGARIHFSRKLKTEELLFGETQGLVLVTIKESDLMEFERVCMTIGVPATTIGRVTDDGRYTFNDSINIPVNKFN